METQGSRSRGGSALSFRFVVIQGRYLDAGRRALRLFGMRLKRSCIYSTSLSVKLPDIAITMSPARYLRSMKSRSVSPVIFSRVDFLPKIGRARSSPGKPRIEPLYHEVFGRVLIHANFLDYHPALAHYVVFVEARGKSMSQSRSMATGKFMSSTLP